MADETRVIESILGPYRGNRLTVSAADADAAINAHWARDPHKVVAPDEEPHPPLSEEERATALAAANDWAQTQWDAVQEGVEPKHAAKHERKKAEHHEERHEQRDVKPEEPPAGGYTTRSSRRV